MRSGMQQEKSLWQWCAACAGCRHWTGWQCLDEPTGFRNCASYGKTWRMQVVAKDAKSGRAKLVTLKRGQTVEDLMAPVVPAAVKSGAAGVGAGMGVNLLDF